MQAGTGEWEEQCAIGRKKKQGYTSKIKSNLGSFLLLLASGGDLPTM
jgi:hypothetical protein